MNRAPPLEHGAALFLRESGEEWSGGRLLRLAANVDTALARGGVGEGQVVGVSSSSAAYVAAAVLALWTRGAEPLVLDPLLRREPDVVLRGHPGMVVLADSPREAMAGAVVVPAMEADISCAPLVPRWPEADRAAASRRRLRPPAAGPGSGAGGSGVGPGAAVRTSSARRLEASRRVARVCVWNSTTSNPGAIPNEWSAGTEAYQTGHQP